MSVPSDDTATRRIEIAAQPFDAEAWKPFGWVPAEDTDPVDRLLTYEFTMGDPHVNVIAHTYDEVEHTDRGPVCDRLYRHDTHTQTLMPLNVDSVVVVAPADVDFSAPEHLDSVRAFVLHPLDRLTLHRGTWHWGPFPLGHETVRLFNVQGKRYADDNAHVDLPARAGATFEVLA
jgi:ureidoglycolate hydrolase